MIETPLDWPKEGPIDLDIQDLPHRSSSTEWWYINSHIETVDGRKLALFASFFRVVRDIDPKTKRPLYAHSLTWAISDLDAAQYFAESRVDKCAPQMGLKRLEKGEGTRDPRLRRALREVLEKGHVPYPDQMFEGEVFVAENRLDLDYDGARFHKRSDGAYVLNLWSEHHQVGCDLVFEAQKKPIRHGDNGVVRGAHGEDMFYYFIPRCDVTGTVTTHGLKIPVQEASGWYDHEFGGYYSARTDEEQLPEEFAWNWLSLQLDDGSDVTAYELICTSDEQPSQKCAILSDSGGRRNVLGPASIEPVGEWSSTRTFNTYPTQWRFQVPDAKIDLSITASFEDQEFITLLSKPAFWEGRVEAKGSVGGRPIQGRGWIERSGFSVADDLDGFFKAVGKEVRKSVRQMAPFSPTYEQVRDLIASEDRDQYMDGVDIDQFTDTMIRPVREITDRGGKSWRSYASLACCDIVGGDSRKFVQWLAMPELMHVGSLIVDDVQDKSTVRRGGKTCHMIYGEPIAINAGTAAYFMGQQLLIGPDLSPADKLRLYDLYFEALRAGHAGQAFDLDGLYDDVPIAVETGDSQQLERRILAIHRLKTAAPAGALSRMGAVVGGGSEEQIEALGSYFEAVGLAFQVIDDVLNLRGFQGQLKSRGEDISHGKVTMPMAKAFARMSSQDRQWLWKTLQEKPTDERILAKFIEKVEVCGALDACVEQAKTMVNDAWELMDPLVEDSLAKLMLRGFGWYVLERHY
jgi:geranylgeranyl pyrophosphate synthase/predicted secreted hydrolase